MRAQKLQDLFRRKVRHQTKIQSSDGNTRKDSLYSGLGVTRLNTADRTSWTKDVFFNQRRSLHGAHPATYAKFPFETDFVQLDQLEYFRVLSTYGSDLRRKPINGNHALRRGDRGQPLDQPPR